ncbi:hypothetical protein FB45DRAFT_31107 [Roridomyces roridus]|uniref:Uncharacterized protein n=1 Tax=Roridomyces roridus TaxID=1738132 RepID=A0AAD7G2U3_9AGAR|nr:hypothetical protein FB45DRAFT_31107 [Roridomyces roridus]
MSRKELWAVPRLFQKLVNVDLAPTLIMAAGNITKLQVALFQTMSATQTQQVPTLPDQAAHFPSSWLVEYPEAVADRTLWNRENPTPDNVYRSQFNANWAATITTPYFKPTVEGVAIGPTFIRHYFGLEGCVIPIAALSTADTPAILFILAGPADGARNKEFYAYFHDQDRVEDIALCRVGRYASVDELYRKFYVDGCGPYYNPVDGGEDAERRVLDKCGYWVPEPDEE